MEYTAKFKVTAQYRLGEIEENHQTLVGFEVLIMMTTQIITGTAPLMQKLHSQRSGESQTLYRSELSVHMVNYTSTV